MKGLRFTGYVAAALTVCVLVVAPAAAAPGNLILQVPDWNQPDSYAAATPGLAVGDYPCWCAPTAGANLMGYWEDVMGCTGLTDQQAFAASPAYPAAAGTWQQGLWHDGTIEMGWYMDTGGWQSVPRPFPPKAGSTAVANIGPGMQTYATTGWVDGATGITKTAYPNTTIGIDTARNATMWNNYKAEIDAGRPTVSTFAHWVGAMTGTDTVDGFPNETIEKYGWNTSIEEHSVTGVGYIDYTAGYQGDGIDEWFVVHDNWGSTGQFVAVPLDTNWLQNDYVTQVPEPVTLGLLASGGLVLILRRKGS
jgi:hypothetical protein